MRQSSSNQRLTRRDALVSAALFVAFALLYGLTTQGRVYGLDGAFLCDWSTLPDTSYGGYHNVLFHRTAYVFTAGWTAIAPPADPLTPVRVFVAVVTAAGLALGYLTSRGLGASVGASLGAVSLLGVSPAIWFFGTTVEVHSLHFALVNLVCAVLVLAPWRSVPVALALSCATVPLLYLSHQSAPALGFGLLLLAQCGRLRACPDRPFGWIALGCVGAALLAALLLGQATANAVRGEGFAIGVGAIAEAVEFWQRPNALAVLRDEIAYPLLLLGPLALAGWLPGWRRAAHAGGSEPTGFSAQQRRFARWRRAASFALFAPTAAFLVYWGIVERGGYVAGPSIALALIIADLFDTPRVRTALGRGFVWAVGGLILVQATFGLLTVRTHDDAGWQIDQRIAVIERTFAARDATARPAGVVLSAIHLAPLARIHLPDIHEVDLLPTLNGVKSVEQWESELVNLEVLLTIAGQSPFVLDRSYRTLVEHWDGMLEACLERLELRIEERFDVTPVDDPTWPMWLVTPR